MFANNWLASLAALYQTNISEHKNTFFICLNIFINYKMLKLDGKQLFFLFYVKISEDQINLFLRNKQVHITSRARSSRSRCRAGNGKHWSCPWPWMIGCRNRKRSWRKMRTSSCGCYWWFWSVFRYRIMI